LVVTEAAKAFEEYIKKENITGFQIREPGDERQTTVFESELEIEGRRLPILVIIDATAYATVRIRLAQNAVDELKGEAEPVRVVQGTGQQLCRPGLRVGKGTLRPPSCGAYSFVDQ